MAPRSVRSALRMRVAVVAPTVSVLAALLMASSVGLYGLSTARAVVGAEGLWSRAASAAIQSLERYIERGDQADLTRFEQSVRVPLSMRDARISLQTPGVEIRAAAGHFVDAGLNREDALLMCYLYRLFQDLDWTRKTVAAWEGSDRLIEQLVELASLVPRSQLEDSQTAASRLRVAIVDLSDRFAIEQRHFSDRIGERSRWISHASVLAIALFAGLMATTAATSALRLQRKEAESRLEVEAAHQRLSLATQSDQLGVFEWRVGNDFMLLDARCCEIYGLPCGNGLTPIDRSMLWTRVPQDDHGDIQDVIERAARKRSMFKHRYRVVPFLNQVRHVEITGIFTKVTGLLLMTGVIRDVTEEVTRAKAEAQSRAEEFAAQTKSRLLSRLNHELRTPLNAVLGFTQLLLVHSRDMKPEHHTWIEEIERAGRGLLCMIDDVLRISKLAGEGLPFPETSVDIRQVLASVLATFEETERQRFEVRPRESTGLNGESVRADPPLVHEALKRVMAHALQIEPRQRQMVVTLVAEDDAVEVHVAGRGWEIPRQDTGSFLTQPPAPHLGFSLALAEAILQQTNATLQMVPLEGGGAMVVIRFSLENSANEKTFR